MEQIKQKEIDTGIKMARLNVELDYTRSELKDCVNELCLKCGAYHNEHNGACDDCRWLKPRRGW